METKRYFCELADTNVQVADPYYWLEDPDSEETKEWVEKQIALTTGYFSNFKWKEQTKKRFDFDTFCLLRMTELYDYPKFGCPHKEGNKYLASIPSLNLQLLLLQE
jgi:prolyl oligopeptidase